MTQKEKRNKCRPVVIGVLLENGTREEQGGGEMELRKGRAGRSHLAQLCEPPWAAGGKPRSVSKNKTYKSIFWDIFCLFLNNTSPCVLEGAHFCGHGTKEPGTGMCSSPSSRGNSLPGRSLQGGLPMEESWEKGIAKSLKTDMVICATALPQGLQAALGVQVSLG